MKPLPVKTQTAPLTAKHPLYSRWRTVINRCCNPKSVNYKRYGARGITVCDRWLSFPLFVEDMGCPPDNSYVLDRTDNNGGYSPENCRWVTPKQNALNRRDNVICTFNGETRTVAEWSAYLGIKPITLYQRLSRMPVEHALTRKVGPARGSDFASRTVLTEEDAFAIKHSTRTLKETAKAYGVSLSTVSGIRHGKVWKHLG